MVASLSASLTRRHSPIPLPLPFGGTLHMCYFFFQITRLCLWLVKGKKRKNLPAVVFIHWNKWIKGWSKDKGVLLIKTVRVWNRWMRRKSGATECSASRVCHWNVLCDTECLFKSPFSFSSAFIPVTILCENAIFSSALSGSFACWQLPTGFQLDFSCYCGFVEYHSVPAFVLIDSCTDLSCTDYC